MATLERHEVPRMGVKCGKEPTTWDPGPYIDDIQIRTRSEGERERHRNRICQGSRRQGVWVGGYHLLRVEMQVSICGATSTVSSMTPGMSKSIVPVA